MLTWIVFAAIYANGIAVGAGLTALALTGRWDAWPFAVIGALTMIPGAVMVLMRSQTVR
jgi:hypothetical protein